MWNLRIVKKNGRIKYDGGEWEFDEGNRPRVGALVAFQGKRGFMDELDVYYTTYYGDPITGILDRRQ